MKAAWIGLAFTLVGCADFPGTATAPQAGAAPVGAQQAYFAEFPAGLFAFLAANCEDPGDQLVVPDPTPASEFEMRCESLPSPEAAAAIILQFDGTVEELPKIITSLAGRPTTEGYLVTSDNYIRVPFRDGGVRRVTPNTARFKNDLRDLLEAAGGRPL